MGCEREHWIGQARVYDNGDRMEPRILPMDGTPAGDPDCGDRTHYFPPNPDRGEVGFLRITFWGHDHDAVLAAVTDRYTAAR
jgi:hypothetical protein